MKHMVMLEDAPSVVLWNMAIYTCDSIKVDAEFENLYVDRTFSAKNSFCLNNTEFDYETYKSLFEAYFPVTTEYEYGATGIWSVSIDTLHNAMFGLRLKSPYVLPLGSSPNDVQWGFTEGVSSVRSSNFITGSAVEDFNQILDPKLLK